MVEGGLRRRVNGMCMEIVGMACGEGKRCVCVCVCCNMVEREFFFSPSQTSFR